MINGLTPKQQLFIDAYLISFNATQAAIEAGYSEKTAYSIGARLLKNVEISEAIRSRLQASAMSADEVLMRLAEQARNEHGKYITQEGAVNLAQLIADGKGHLIKGIKETQFGRNIEFYDAQAALGLIGKHHKLFVERTEVTGKDGKDLNLQTQVTFYLPDNGRNDSSRED